MSIVHAAGAKNNDDDDDVHGNSNNMSMMTMVMMMCEFVLAAKLANPQQGTKIRTWGNFFDQTS